MGKDEFKLFRESITTELINSQLSEFITEVYGENFTFREHQREIIVKTIINILKNNFENQIIEAPTGSGKSIINIVSAAFLAKYYNKSSYILCSDLYLFSQYEEEIKCNEYYDKNIAFIKGQYGNYKCYRNGQDIRNGICRLEKTSWKDILKPFDKKYENSPNEWKFPCAKNCDYCKQKAKIKTANVVITTYQNLLYQYLLLGDNKATPSFILKNLMPFSLRPKQLLFCDEAHNIPAIIQNHFTPEFKESQLEEIFLPIYDYCHDNDINYSFVSTHECMQLIGGMYDREWYKNTFNKFLNILEKKCFKNYELLQILIKYHYEYFSRVKGAQNAINEYVNKKLEDNKIKFNTNKAILDPEDWEILGTLLKFEELMCKFSDVLEALSATGHNYLLKKINEPIKDGDEKNYTVHCLAENYLCDHFFLSLSKNKVFTTATVGNKKQFDQNLGIPLEGYENSKLFKIPSTFEFKDSPIYFVNKYSMNYRNKNISFPYIIHFINEISNFHKEDRGIIHTASYVNKKFIMDNVSDELRERLFIYENSREKEEIIKRFKNSKNGILIGPSITQGVDLPDDLCRFNILIKVPYMNIKDEFVKAKSKIFPYWYSSQASIEIIQAIGRGIRNKHDFCKTYILDAEFERIFNLTNKQYPNDIKDRLIYFQNFSQLKKIFNNSNNKLKNVA